MKRTKQASMFSFRILFLAPVLALFLAGKGAESQESARHGVVPLHKISPGQWVDKVWGDPDKPGAPFVLRIHNDAGYIVLPHTHRIDEYIVLVRGDFSLGIGRRFDRSALEPMGIGDFACVPKSMAHFAWSKTETIIQVHGIGPFSSSVLDPVYELTDNGVFLLTSLLQAGSPTQSSPPDYFALKIAREYTVMQAKALSWALGARLPISSLNTGFESRSYLPVSTSARVFYNAKRPIAQPLQHDWLERRQVLILVLLLPPDHLIQHGLDRYLLAFAQRLRVSLPDQTHQEVDLPLLIKPHVDVDVRNMIESQYLT